jgi:lysophospholipase L1-like esterase
MSCKNSAFVLITLVCVVCCSTFGQTANSAQQSNGYAIPESDDGLPGAGPIRRYPWFQKLWLSKRSGWAKQVQKDQKALVFLGDSITQGWGDNMGNSFRGVKVANRGISGDTTRGMLIRLKEDVLSLNPSGVVMLMGTNDLEEGAKPAVIAGNLKLIVAALKKHNAKMPIILCNVFPSSASKKRSAADIRQINQLYFAAVKGDPQITVIDTWTLFANKNGDARKEEFPDLLHPNKDGYKKWAAALTPILATTGFVETEPDAFVIEPGFTSLFNGKDLTGWGYQPTTPQMMKSRARWRKNNPDAPPWPIIKEPISFDGKTSTPDGRYVAMNGRLIVTTPPEGRRIQQLWTTKEFGDDFVLKLEFRATPNADSGVFVRKPQLQCRDFTLAGPWKDLKGYRPQGWNELLINVKGEVAHCTCNGEVLNAEFKVPASGPIGLEGDRGQVEYRRIRIGKDDGDFGDPEREDD